MNRIMSFFKKISIPFRRYRIEIYERPAVWMTEKQLSSLHQRLVDIASVSQGKAPDIIFFKDKMLLANKIVVICTDRERRRDFCFCAMTHLGSYKKRNVYHLGAVFSGDENKGLMQLIYLFGLLYIFIKNWFFRKVYFTSLTHTPKIFGVVSESFVHVYPNLNPDAQPYSFHNRLRDLFSITYLTEWDLPVKPVINRDFILRGFRIQKDGSMLFPVNEQTVPRHRNEEYNRRIFQLLDFSKGDEIFQAGLSTGFALLQKNFRIFAKA